MIINVSIFLMHWLLVRELKITGIQAWPAWKKTILTIFDAIIGVGAATIFFVFMAGLAASGQMMFAKGLKWGTEGRAQTKNDAGEEKEESARTESGEDVSPKSNEEALMKKRRSTRTLESALANSQLLMNKPVVEECAVDK